METFDIVGNPKWIECWQLEPKDGLIVMATYDYKKEFEAMLTGGRWIHKTNLIATPLAWRSE